MTYLLWFLIAFSILAIGYGYIGWRLILRSHLHQPWRRVAWSVLAVLFLVPIISIVLDINHINSGAADLLVWVSYVTLGLFSFVLTLLLMRDIIWLVVAGVQKLMATVSSVLGAHPKPSAPTDPHRREVLVQTMNLAILGISTGSTAYGFYQARRRPAIVEVNIPINNLPGDLEGFRIVQITDIHAGLTVKRSFVETVVEMANELNGDIIAFTGDLVDGPVRHLQERVAPMANLAARYGRYFITGNHEYYSGAEPWVEEAKRLGFEVLLNEHRVVQHGSSTILVAGVTDASAGQFIPRHTSDPHKAIAGAPATDVKILLAHQPRSLYEAAKAGFDLQISGHTHGGQFFPWNLVTSIGQPFIKGLHKFQNAWIYVSNGTGYWGPPVRLGTRSEITLLTLTAANKQSPDMG